MNWLLALTTAALLILSVPHFDIGFLAAIALAPLLVALGREWRMSRHFLLGWLAGSIYWCGVCYWIQAVLQVEGGLGAVGGWACFFLFCLAKGLHMAVFSTLAGMVMPKWYAVPAVAALWTGIERLHGPLGFTWFLLGNAGIDMDVPMRLAPWTGVYGLSFCFALMGAAVALVLMRRQRREIAWLAALPALFLLPALPPVATGAEQAVVVQPNISQTTSWNPETFEAFTRKLESLSLSAALRAGDQPSRLILWPEMPAPLYYYRDAELRASVATLARLTQAHVLLGTVGHIASNAPTNSAVMVAPNGEPAGRYNKVHLVPFGEFVPALFGFVNKITTEAGDFQPGSEIVLFPTDGHRNGVFICYESVFPDYVRQFAAQGADVLINLSNDGYFARSGARTQHLKIARMRAAENRRWLIRATNDGITATVDPAGRLSHSIEPYIATAVRTQFSYVSEKTAYTRFGDWFAWTCLALGIVLAGLSQVPSYSRSRPESRL